MLRRKLLWFRIICHRTSNSFLLDMFVSSVDLVLVMLHDNSQPFIQTFVNSTTFTVTTFTGASALPSIHHVAFTSDNRLTCAYPYYKPTTMAQ